MRVAITGHRPDKLSRPFKDYVDELRTGLELLGATYVIQGMAAGIDLLAAKAAHADRIPFEAAVPYAGHRTFNKDPMWQNEWDNAYKYADERTILSEAEKYPGPWVFHKRNQYMVDHADVVLSVWDGSPKGGTKACIDYAIKQDRTIFNIDPSTFDRRILHESRVCNLSG